MLILLTKVGRALKDLIRSIGSADNPIPAKSTRINEPSRQRDAIILTYIETVNSALRDYDI